MEGERWQDWSSCEMYGHDFVDGRCTDCPETSDQVVKVTIVTAEEAEAFRERVRRQREELATWVVIPIDEAIELLEGRVNGDQG